jgi:glycosyltransferase involved in cell wall biosynthesis
VETILKAAKLISKEKGIQFKFVGFDGSKYDKNSNVEFKGKIEKDSDFVKELSDSDLFISAYEGDFATGAYPHKLSTYLSLGKPIIASDISDCRYILEKSKSGKAFPVKDYKSLALVIKTFYSMDKAKFDKMGKNARRFAEEKLDSHKLYAQLEKSYSDYSRVELFSLS